MSDNEDDEAPESQGRVGGGSGAITRGSHRFPACTDGRSAWARRLRDVLAEHVADLGGVANVSAAERSILRRAAVLTIELERMESRFAANEPSPDALDLYQRAAGNLRRLLESIGLERRARDVTQTIEQIAAEIAAEEDTDEAHQTDQH